ncbi:Imm44 family immunity protein [Bacillus cereus group sp. BfR-BA-01380]|uniref:Imm44 family immunity protein n=1 Tax=Bacillus cereus group sp. BfR-BA-01380 TaxID=2920324 RepID=UPI001F57779F|nr:Imm44 family immunity protein [Bacillus cereus group sp. BfR-BA-01380]
MEFFISGEVDKSVSEYFNKIRREMEKKLQNLQEKNYGSAVNGISIIPIIVPPDLLQLGFFEERRLFQRKEKDCDYRLQINFQKFLNGDKENRKLLLIKNLIETIRSIGTKSKKAKLDFDALALERDILELFEVESETIDPMELVLF